MRGDAGLREGPPRPPAAGASRPVVQAPRWFTVGAFFRLRLGGGARKIPLDAGFSCPNRDGTLSRSGCIFCNPAGSGTGLAARGLSLAGQWALLAGRARRRYPKARLLAYLQSYTNTHCAPERLAAVLAELAALPGSAGVCLGTRPDCLDVGTGDARLDVLAAAGLPFLQLDIGLQSADDAVLRRINRGHDAACFARAAAAAAGRGMFVCAHVVHGLPGAGPVDLRRSVEFLNGLPVAGVKFHNLLVCRGTGLEAAWRTGRFVPAERGAYLTALADALPRLRPDIAVQRLFADPAPGELLAPAWAGAKAESLALFRARMERENLWQGKNGFCPDAPPDYAALAAEKENR